MPDAEYAPIIFSRDTEGRSHLVGGAWPTHALLDPAVAGIVRIKDRVLVELTFTQAVYRVRRECYGGVVEADLVGWS